jgi:hypothetical protein
MQLPHMLQLQFIVVAVAALQLTFADFRQRTVTDDLPECADTA